MIRTLLAFFILAACSSVRADTVSLNNSVNVITSAHGDLTYSNFGQPTSTFTGGQGTTNFSLSLGPINLTPDQYITGALLTLQVTDPKRDVNETPHTTIYQYYVSVPYQVYAGSYFVCTSHNSFGQCTSGFYQPYYQTYYQTVAYNGSPGSAGANFGSDLTFNLLTCGSSSLSLNGGPGSQDVTGTPSNGETCFVYGSSTLNIYPFINDYGYYSQNQLLIDVSQTQDVYGTLDLQVSTSVPEPATVLLLTSGLFAGGVRRFRNRV